jgi:hypothetical protein
MEDIDFWVVAIPTDIVEAVRATMRSPRYDHPASEEIAGGYGPCRHCLREFEVGAERRILFTYDPFTDLERLPLPGPVFVHSRACERFPEAGGFPSELRAHELTFNAYGRGRRLVAQVYGTNAAIDANVERLLARPDVEYIHVRDTEAGCYDFRIERAETRNSQ